MPNILADVNHIKNRGTTDMTLKVNNTTVVTLGSSAITLAQPVTTAYLYVPGAGGNGNGQLTLKAATGYTDVIISQSLMNIQVSGLAAGKVVRVTSADGTTEISGTGIASENWITPTLVNGWVRYTDTSFVPPGYYRDKLGIVHLRGLVGNGAQSSTLFTLPVNYRPDYRILCISQCNGGTARIDITTAGAVIAEGLPLNGYLTLDEISFRATYI